MKRKNQSDKEKRKKNLSSIKLKKLTQLCIDKFGVNYESWKWEIDSGIVPGFPKKMGGAIELPKYDKSGKLIYTDPFVGYSPNGDLSLAIACEKAIEYLTKLNSYPI